MAFRQSITIEVIYRELFQGDSFNHYPSNNIDAIIPDELYIGSIKQTEHNAKVNSSQPSL